MVECLPRKHKALSSNSSTTKKNNLERNKIVIRQQLCQDNSDDALITGGLS
jgi:hypothetical protein